MLGEAPHFRARFRNRNQQKEIKSIDIEETLRGSYISFPSVCTRTKPCNIQTKSPACSFPMSKASDKSIPSVFGAAARTEFLWYKDESRLAVQEQLRGMSTRIAQEISARVDEKTRNRGRRGGKQVERVTRLAETKAFFLIFRE